MKKIAVLAALLVAAAAAFAQAVPTLSIDYQVNLVAEDYANNYLTFRGPVASANKDQYDVKTSASKLESTLVFNYYRNDVLGKKLLPGGLRSLFLYPVADYKTLTDDALKVFKNADGSITVRYAHRGTAYETTTGTDGKLVFPGAAFKNRKIGYIQGEGPQVISTDFSASGKAADIDWAKVWDAKIAGGKTIGNTTQKTGDIVVDTAASALAAYEGALQFSTDGKIFKIAGELKINSAAVAATATKYFVAHQGGYIGEATVSIDANGNVVDASLAEWQGPGGWAENNSADGKSIVDGAVVRVPDPLANTANADPAIKGYMFYIYNVQNGVGVWSQFTPGKDGFTRPARQYERDFEGLMSNPIRAAAYAKAAREDSLVNVKIEGTKVVVGKKASETVHYGHMDKANVAAVYMPLTKDSIGYRYNNLATLAFFKANPTANFAAAVLKKAKLSVAENKAVDAAAAAATYVAADDSVYFVADVVTGATYSDFQHYSLELQAAYKAALAEARVKFAK